MFIPESSAGKTIFTIFYEKPFLRSIEGNLRFVAWEEARAKPLQDLAGNLCKLAVNILALDPSKLNSMSCWYEVASDERNSDENLFGLVCAASPGIEIDDEKCQLFATCVVNWLASITSKSTEFQSDLDFQDFPPEVRQCMTELKVNFVRRVDGGRIVNPLRVAMKHQHCLLSGRYADAETQPIETEILHRSISGFDAFERTVNLRDTSKRKEVVAMDLSKFADQLAAVISEGLTHEVVVGPAKTLGGKEIRELKAIGDPVRLAEPSPSPDDLFGTFG